MSNGQKIMIPVYRQIAIDIAKNVANGTYTEGQKLFGRSVLASHYGVSPETVRRAVYLLKDVGILDSEKGSGVEVLSMEKAKLFLEFHDKSDNITVIKNDIRQWAMRQTEEIAEIVKKIQFIVGTAERSAYVSPLAPYEILVNGDSVVIGKNVDELRFWHNTGGTIVAIRRDDALIISPGPYALCCANDVFYIVGDANSYAAAIKLFYG